METVIFNQDIHMNTINELREKGRTYKEIARTLNRMGIRTKTGRKIQGGMVSHYIRRSDPTREITTMMKHDKQEGAMPQPLGLAVNMSLIRRIGELRGVSESAKLELILGVAQEQM